MKTHLAAALLGAALAVGASAFVVDNERTQHRAAILQIESTAQAAALAAADTAREQQREISTQYQKAINDAIKHQNILRADAVRARNQLASLRSQTQAAASRIAMPDTPTAAVAEYGIAAGELLADCGREYIELAEKADGHVATVRMMRDAWPTYQLQPKD